MEHPSSENPLSGRLTELSQCLNDTRVIAEPQPSSRVPVLGPFVNLLHRLANRLLMHWYVAPMVEQQARFNEQVTAAFDELARIAVEQEAQVRKERDLLREILLPGGARRPRGLSASGNLESLLALSPEDLRAWEMLDIPQGADTSAEEPLAAVYDEDLVISGPFSWHQQIGWHYMFNLAVLGQALQCRPGDLVLDFAGGSGWAAEYMVRFGFRTVLLDYAETSLRRSRVRFAADRRLQQHLWMLPVLGDGMRLPFDDETFDGIVCMNALHHMPSYETTLREMARVLKPGCRAIFAEPGESHTQDPLSQQMMREHGIFEKNVPLVLVHVYALRAGFARMWRYPYVYPEFMELPFPEQGRDAQTVLEHLVYTLPRLLARLSLFALQKGGERALDSNASHGELQRHPLLARITFLRCSAEATVGTTFVDRVQVMNIGDALWLATARPLGGYVRLGVKLTDTNGRVLEQGEDRPFLPHDVAPGEMVELDVPIRAPAVPGQYVLKYDMVDEFRAWFESGGSLPVERPLTVTPAD